MEEKKKGFFSRLVEGLTKTRENIVSGMDSIFSGFSAIDDDFYEELEETLIMGDMGIQTTMAVIEDLKKTVKEQHIKDPEQCREALIAGLEQLEAQVGELRPGAGVLEQADEGQARRRDRLGRLVLRLARRHRGRQAPRRHRPRGPAGHGRPGQRPRRLPGVPARVRG